MVSENVVILTKAEFEQRIHESFQRGVERGRLEERTKSWKNPILAEETDCLGNPIYGTFHTTTGGRK